MSAKMEDGIWEFNYGDGERGALYVIGVEAASILRDGELTCPAVLSQMPWKPLRRIASLDGKPLVDEGVIEAIVEDLITFGLLLNRNADGRVVARSLVKKHLDPQKQEQGAEEKALDGDSVPEAKRYLTDLFKHYAPQCNPMDNLSGLISQIDNCMVGMRDQISNLKGKHSDASEYVSRLLQLLKKIRKLVALVPGSPTVMGLPDSDHDSVAVGYVEWIVNERDRLQARVAELEARPTLATYRENATGDEWVFLPEDKDGDCCGLRLKDREFDTVPAKQFASRFTLQPPADDAPIVRFEGAFVCWIKGWDGPYTAWPCEVGVLRFVRHDGLSCGWVTEEKFESEWTRTRPITLSPEHEQLVPLLAKGLNRDESEVRRVLGEGVKA